MKECESAISGAVLAAGLTASISRAFEDKWTVGLVIWVIPCIIGLLTWVNVSMLILDRVLQ
jgi:cyanate permease